MSRKRILAYSIYYYPEVASTAQIYTELFEDLADRFDITVVCAVPCYTGSIPEEYREKRFYHEEHGGCADRARAGARVLEERQGVPRAEHRRFLGAGAEGNP